MKGEIKEIRTATITDKGQICIPNIAREISGFEKGKKISILVYQDRLEIRPMNQISNGLSFALASEKSLSKNWNSKEDDAAWKDL